MINIVFIVSFFMTSRASLWVDGTQSTLEEDLELERQLKLINKPPIKSIQTKFGYIVDCIDIKKQPAFDHPLLKNHKLQRKPSFQKSIGRISVEKFPAKPIFGLDKDQCPAGTVPIRRTTKDDLIRTKSLLDIHIMTQDLPGIHVAEVSVVLSNGDGPYHGVSGSNSIYNPKVTKNQLSSSHLWVQNGPIDATNKIALGWHAAPYLYGDDGTHIYASWTSDNFHKTGCMDLQCSGFVQTNKVKYLGARVEDTSIYGGEMIDVAFAISQDPINNNWWLKVEKDLIGYFPAALFSNMTSADQIGWGGRTRTPPCNPSPPMGSGYFPDEKLVHACYFRNVSFLDANRANIGPDIEAQDIHKFTDKPDCYGVEYYGDEGDVAGYFLEFGGPGGGGTCASC